MSKPLVSICCLAYNHESYIRECLDGFIMQKTDFPFEVLIHDDASTDNTANVIREYEAQYPDIIKPIYQTENQYSQGVRVTTVYNFTRAKGKYIALCEGDDYWTDPLKLQKQVDFLEENEDCIACGCYTDIERFGKIEISTIDIIEKKTTQLDLVIKNPFPTLTLLFRNIDFQPFANYIPVVGDIELFMYLSQFGNFRKLPFKGGIYRFHGKGANSGNDYYTNTKNHIRAKLKFNSIYKIHDNKCYKVKIRNYIKIELIKMFKNMVRGKRQFVDNLNFINFCLKKYKTL